MDDYISREAARPDAFCDGVSCQECPFLKNSVTGGCRVDDFIKAIPAADVRPVVLCRDCIHRPYSTEPGETSGFAVEAPDRECKCPCFNPDDGWYSWIPDDYFFCGNGERREGGTP